MWEKFTSSWRLSIHALGNNILNNLRTFQRIYKFKTTLKIVFLRNDLGYICIREHTEISVYDFIGEILKDVFNTAFSIIVINIIHIFFHFSGRRVAWQRDQSYSLCEQFSKQGQGELPLSRRAASRDDFPAGCTRVAAQTLRFALLGRRATNRKSTSSRV